MKATVDVQVTWSGRLVESYELKKSKESIDKNLNTTKEFISLLAKNYEIKNGNYLWKHIKASQIKEFLKNFQLLENLKA